MPAPWPGRSQRRRYGPTVKSAQSSRSRRLSALCALAAVLASLITIWATNDGWPDASQLVKVANTDPLAALAITVDSDFNLVGYQEHYDGAYYYAIALDPAATGLAHTLIDQAAYRYGRPLHGWLARFIAVGQADFFPEALLLLSIAGMAALAYGVSQLSLDCGRSAWAGLIVAMSPGLLFSSTVSTTEPASTALVVWLIVFWQRNARPVVIAAVSTAMLFYREQLMVVLIGLVLSELVMHFRVRDTSKGPSIKRLAALAVGPLLLASWWLWVHSRFDAWPRPQESGNIDLPARGWLETFAYARWLQTAGGTAEQQIGSTAPAYLIAMAVLLLTALVVARRVRTPLEAVLIVQVVFVSLLSWRTLVYPHEMYRIAQLPMAIAIGVLLLQPTPGIGTGRPKKGSEAREAHLRQPN